MSKSVLWLWWGTIVLLTLVIGVVSWPWWAAAVVVSAAWNVYVTRR